MTRRREPLRHRPAGYHCAYHSHIDSPCHQTTHGKYKLQEPLTRSVWRAALILFALSRRARPLSRTGRAHARSLPRRWPRTPTFSTRRDRYLAPLLGRTEGPSSAISSFLINTWGSRRRRFPGHRLFRLRLWALRDSTRRARACAKLQTWLLVWRLTLGTERRRCPGSFRKVPGRGICPDLLMESSLVAATGNYAPSGYASQARSRLERRRVLRLRSYAPASSAGNGQAVPPADRCPPGQPPPSSGNQSRPWAAATAWWVTCPSTTLTPAARAGSRSAAARQPRSAISRA